jgi:large subunit ribosomal protein L19
MRKEIIEFNKTQRKSAVPELRAGDSARVHRKIVEGGKKRIQVFEGMVIAVKGKQSSSPTVTVRKVTEGVGVELIIPLYSPEIVKIELVKRAKTRRSKIYYVRTKPAKSLRMKHEEAEESAKKEDAKKEPEKKEE